MEAPCLIKPGTSCSFIIESSEKGMRLDAYLTEKFPGYSRSFFKRVIEEKLVTINKKPVDKAGTALRPGDSLLVTFPQKERDISSNAQKAINMGISIVHQEQDFLIIYKPAGIVAHAPSPKNTSPSLVDWLLTHFSYVADIGYADRPGIVHRLDKDTSGLMIVPLTSPAFATFSQLFKDRKIHKTYLAIVKGHPDKTGSITFSIGRHHTVRNRMAYQRTGRTALTDFTVVTYFEDTTLVEARPVTGRTHQIRVHFTTLGHPLLGDTLYGSASPFIKRQALHAAKIAFEYNGKPYEFSCPLPEDFQQALADLPTLPEDKNPR